MDAEITHAQDDLPDAEHSIARDHARLADLISRIRCAIALENVPEIKVLLLRLAQLYTSHFENEEMAMGCCAYPSLNLHCSEHRALIGTLSNINQTILLENLRSVSVAVADHLEKTLRHTVETDRAFLDFMQAGQAAQARPGTT